MEKQNTSQHLTFSIFTFTHYYRIFEYLNTIKDNQVKEKLDNTVSDYNSHLNLMWEVIGTFNSHLVLEDTLFLICAHTRCNENLGRWIQTEAVSKNKANKCIWQKNNIFSLDSSQIKIYGFLRRFNSCYFIAQECFKYYYSITSLNFIEACPKWTLLHLFLIFNNCLRSYKAITSCHYSRFIIKSSHEHLQDSCKGNQYGQIKRQ